MKIVSIQLVHTKSAPNTSVTLSSASDLSSYSFYQKGSIGEFLTFFSKTVADRTQPSQRQSVQENSYIAHAYCLPQTDELCAVIITDQEYPVRVAFSLLNKIIDEYTAKFTKSDRDNAVATGSGNNRLDFPPLTTYIQKYQDPKQADTIMKVQQELDETKIVLHQTIESVLQRGEKLDSLVERSEALSAQSKMFYKSAKKQNSCCVIM